MGREVCKMLISPFLQSLKFFFELPESRAFLLGKLSLDWINSFPSLNRPKVHRIHLGFEASLVTAIHFVFPAEATFAKLDTSWPRNPSQTQDPRPPKKWLRMFGPKMATVWEKDTAWNELDILNRETSNQRMKNLGVRIAEERENLQEPCLHFLPRHLNRSSYGLRAVRVH